MYVSRLLRAWGLGLPLSFLTAVAGRRGGRSPKSPFSGEKETFLNGHLSWKKIPEELMLQLVQRTSRSKRQE